MSDNDLIRRGDAKAHPFANGMYDCEHADKKFISGHESYKEWLDTVPAVEQPMTAVEYFKQVRRLQKWADQLQWQYHKATGTLYRACEGDINSAIEEVEKWAREHPEEVNNAD